MNYRDDVQALYEFPKTLRIHEGTLRKIEHASGAPEYSPAEKLEIVRLLEAIGVEEIGANPGQYRETIKAESELEGVRAVCAAGLDLEVRVFDHDFGWLRGDFGYVDQLIEYGVDGIDLPIGSLYTDVVWATGRAAIEQTEKSVARALEHVRRKGVDAGVMIADIGRIDLDLALRLMNVWLDHGAERFHLIDSLSTLSPDATRSLVRQVRASLKRPVPTPYHVHNDFGLATACAIAAASAGAWPETSVNGFADRGFASFEEVVLSLELLYGVDTHIKLERLAELSALVERITHSPNHPNKAITGEALWAPQFTTQYTELLQGKDFIGAYISPFTPELVGARWQMMWSANTLSADGIRAKLQSIGITSYDEKDVQAVVAAVKERLQAFDRFPAWVSDAEVERICRRLAKD